MGQGHDSLGFGRTPVFLDFSKTRLFSQCLESGRSVDTWSIYYADKFGLGPKHSLVFWPQAVYGPGRRSTEQVGFPSKDPFQNSL